MPAPAKIRAMARVEIGWVSSCSRTGRKINRPDPDPNPHPHPSPSPSPNANANANSTLAHVGARARQKDQRLEILHVARAHWLRHLHIVRDANTDLGSG